MVSQGYDTREGALNGIESGKVNALAAIIDDATATPVLV